MQCSVRVCKSSPVTAVKTIFTCRDFLVCNYNNKLSKHAPSLRSVKTHMSRNSPLLQPREPSSPPLLVTKERGGFAHAPQALEADDVVGRRLHAPSLSVRRPLSRSSVYEGVLFKRCRMSWRPRIVEVIRDASEYSSGAKYSYHLLFFDPRKRTLKNKISLDDVVTIRASQDCHFQVFLSQGKILQFRAENTDSQSYWMALIKVGLGRGSIFHVRIHTQQKAIDHALLYSIAVTRPANRQEQLDRVLVLASPINDINIQAWDLNRVKRLIRLDIGIQIDLCSACMTARTPSVTFIVDKLFQDDCIRFLCRESRINEIPIQENGIVFYPLKHRCARPSVAYQDPFPQPPSYEQSMRARPLPDVPTKERREREREREEVFFPREIEQGASSTGFLMSDSSSDDDNLPPRDISRRNFESAIPAVATPYINFQPHLFQHRSSSFESPYQISSRIIITDSGKVQYERNILGSHTKLHGGFHFKGGIPLPPRHTQTQVRYPSEQPPPVPYRSYLAPERRASGSAIRRPPRSSENRASEILDSEGTYIFIAPGALTPPAHMSFSPTTVTDSSNHQFNEETLFFDDSSSANFSSFVTMKPRSLSDAYDDVIIVSHDMTFSSALVEGTSPQRADEPRSDDTSQRADETFQRADETSQKADETTPNSDKMSTVSPRLTPKLIPKSPSARRKPAIIPRKHIKKNESSSQTLKRSASDDTPQHTLGGTETDRGWGGTNNHLLNGGFSSEQLYREGGGREGGAGGGGGGAGGREGGAGGGGAGGREGSAGGGGEGGQGGGGQGEAGDKSVCPLEDLPLVCPVSPQHTPSPKPRIQRVQFSLHHPHTNSDAGTNKPSSSSTLHSFSSSSTLPSFSSSSTTTSFSNAIPSSSSTLHSSFERKRRSQSVPSDSAGQDIMYSGQHDLPITDV